MISSLFFCGALEKGSGDFLAGHTVAHQVVSRVRVVDAPPEVHDLVEQILLYKEAAHDRPITEVALAMRAQKEEEGAARRLNAHKIENERKRTKTFLSRKLTTREYGDSNKYVFFLF